MSLNKNNMALSLLICTLIPFIIPSKFFTEGMGSYKFGFPIPYISIYQHKPKSMWLGSNFFSGNAGLSVDPLTFALNMVIIYLMLQLIMQFVTNNFKNRKARPSDD